MNFAPDAKAVKDLREKSGKSLEECRKILHKENMLRYMSGTPSLRAAQITAVVRDLVELL